MNSRRYVLLLLALCGCAAVFSDASFSGGSSSDENSKERAWDLDIDNRTGFWCPDRCTCSFSARIVDCSARRLTQVPALAASTARVYLYDNGLNSLDNTQFQHLHHLTYLILANNVISSVAMDAFKGLLSLKYLILDRNLISDLPFGLFRDLPNLETVSLAHNKLRSLSPDVFSTNTHLSLINLQDNALQRVEDGTLSHLSELHTLDLQNNLCSGSFLTSLRACRNLTILRLSGNRIADLPTDGLQLPSLQLLYLNDNLITELPPHLFNNTHNITKLELKNNFITVLPALLLHDTTSLTSIFLQRNNISRLEEGSFNNLQRLKGIFLSHNALEEIPPLLFHNMSALTTLHLEGNQLTTLTHRCFSHLPSLETLYLQNNRLVSISTTTFVELPQLKYLALYGNRLPVGVFSAGVLNALKSLIKIKLDAVPCSCHQTQLASWSKRHGVRGLHCTSHLTGNTVALAQALEECHVIGEAVGQDIPLSVNGQDSMKKKHDSGSLNQQKLQATQAAASNETVHILELEQRIAELQLRVSRLEVAMEESCQHWVCPHDGARLEAGDTWIDMPSGRTCHCVQGGGVECSE